MPRPDHEPFDSRSQRPRVSPTVPHSLTHRSRTAGSIGNLNEANSRFPGLVGPTKTSVESIRYYLNFASPLCQQPKHNRDPVHEPIIWPVATFLPPKQTYTNSKIKI